MSCSCLLPIIKISIDAKWEWWSFIRQLPSSNPNINTQGLLCKDDIFILNVCTRMINRCVLQLDGPIMIKVRKISYLIRFHFQGWESVGGLRKAIINVTLNISKTYFIIHFKRLSRSLCNLKTRKWQWNSWDKPIWSQTLKYHLQKFCECSLAIVCRILCERKNSVLRVNKHSKMLLFF